jgi:hypothetical protein
VYIFKWKYGLSITPGNFKGTKAACKTGPLNRRYYLVFFKIKAKYIIFIYIIKPNPWQADKFARIEVLCSKFVAPET